MFNKGQGRLMLLLIGFILICFWGMLLQEEEALGKEDFVRLHVVANSNSERDQALKLAVRDEILRQISPVLAKMKSAEESREWLACNIDEINLIAQKTLEREECDYLAKTQMGVRWIPKKTYGSITFPSGNYDACTVKLGEAKGENWWCVMFPPICVVGENKEAKELSEEFKGTKYEELVECSANGSPYVLKFKSQELYEKFLKWIKN